MTEPPPASGLGTPPDAPSLSTRLAGTVVGAVSGLILGSLAAWVPALADAGGLLTVAGAIAGAVLGFVRPARFASDAGPLPEAAPGRPAPVGTLGTAISRDLESRLPIAIVISAAIGLAAPLGSLAVVSWTDLRPSLTVIGLITVAGFVAAIVTAVTLPPFLLGRPARAAFVAHTWLGAREAVRAFGSRGAAARMIGTPGGAARWAATQPETDSNRGVHAEVHLMLGDLDAARAVIERLPAGTPRERFDRALFEAIVAYQATGIADASAARSAAAEIPPGPEAVEAQVSLATFEARRRLPDGDWRAPLVDARRIVPESDATIILRDHGRVTSALLLARVWPVVLGLFVLVLVLGLSVDLAR
ncbi:MAG: hypothetical protein M3Y29_02015 [Chloroflexota bacterium]|nr:hypothetical protein [Chloroflexota bacterium]